jgi:hypothetical protein
LSTKGIVGKSGDSIRHIDRFVFGLSTKGIV